MMAGQRGNAVFLLPESDKRSASVGGLKARVDNVLWCGKAVYTLYQKTVKSNNRLTIVKSIEKNDD